jgi:hypothetical protein
MRSRESCGSKIVATLALTTCLSLSLAAVAADSITGTARNQTRDRLAAGDEVILLRLDQGMQEEARTKTNSQGAFTLTVQYPDKLHLVRVVHQGVNYDQRASAGNAVSIDVFDAAAKVHSVTGSIEIIRTGTSGNLLHVSDMVEIKNDSSPPLTQAGERTFEVYLPAHARIDSVLAASSGNIGVLISAAPVPGEPGHYTVNFPLRPGSTKFAFNYDVPYDGHLMFRTKMKYPLRQLAVMMPPTMKFTPRSPGFKVLATGDSSYQVEVADDLKTGEGPGFEISGTGAMPSIQARGQSRPQPQANALPRPAFPARGSVDQRSFGKSDLHGVSPAPASSASPLQWWILGSAAVAVLGVCGFLIWSTRHSLRPTTKTATAPARQARQSPASLLDVLKEELFQLETDKLNGSISSEEYDAAKRVLDGTVKRALARGTAR